MMKIGSYGNSAITQISSCSHQDLKLLSSCVYTNSLLYKHSVCETILTHLFTQVSECQPFLQEELYELSFAYPYGAKYGN